MATRLRACIARLVDSLRREIRFVPQARPRLVLWRRIRRAFARAPERLSSRGLAWVLTGCVLLALALPSAAQPASGGFFGQILTGLQSATDQWVIYLLSHSPPGVAFAIFGLCLILQVAYFGYRVLISAAGGTPMPLGQALARQLLILVFLASILWHWDEMGIAPMAIFTGLGQDVTGLDRGIEPDVLAATAIGMMQIFLSPKLILFTNPAAPTPFVLFYFLFALATVGSLLAIAVRALMLTVEGHLLATLGAIPFAFSGFRYTAPLADGYIRYAVKFGIEYMLLLFFLDLGGHFAASWAAELAQLSAFQQGQIFVFILRITATAIAWALLAIRLPAKFANEIVHLWTPGIGEALK